MQQQSMSRKSKYLTLVLILGLATSLITTQSLFASEKTRETQTTIAQITADTHINRGLAYAQSKQYEQALAEINEALEINPQHARAYLSRGLVYGQLTKVEQALADFNQAIKIDPQYAEAYENKAVMYAYLGNKPEAKKNLEEAARLYKIQNNSRKYQEISQILQSAYK